MSYAFVLSTSLFIEHTPFNRGVFTMKLHYFPPVPASGEDFGTVEGPGSTTKIDALKLHGWFLWAVWVFLGFFQIASSRYMKTCPKINQWLHMISGTLTLLLTIALSLLGFYWNDW
jgi:hypothetical protein